MTKNSEYIPEDVSRKIDGSMVGAIIKMIEWILDKFEVGKDKTNESPQE